MGVIRKYARVALNIGIEDKKSALGVYPSCIGKALERTWGR